MFSGINKVTLDAKGRMAIPTRYRQRIAEICTGQMAITVDVDYCLSIFPKPDWEELARRLMRLPSLDQKSRRLQRLMVGYATEVELDGHGRVLLSRELREFASLDRQAVLIGQGNRLELWDATRWNERRDEWLTEEESGSGGLPADLASLSF